MDAKAGVIPKEPSFLNHWTEAVGFLRLAFEEQNWPPGKHLKIQLSPDSMLKLLADAEHQFEFKEGHDHFEGSSKFQYQDIEIYVPGLNPELDYPVKNSHREWVKVRPSTVSFHK